MGVRTHFLASFTVGGWTFLRGWKDQNSRSDGVTIISPAPFGRATTPPSGAS
jgi:hypothetical protein